MVLRCISLFLLIQLAGTYTAARGQSLAPRVHGTEAPYEQLSLDQLLATLGWSSFAQTSERISRLRIGSKHFITELDAKLQRANGVWNMGTTMAYCSGGRNLDKKAIYTVFYETAQKMTSKRDTSAQRKAQYALILKPADVERFFQVDSHYRISGSAYRLIKKIIATWKFEDLTAYLIIGLLRQKYPASEATNYAPAIYRELYLYTQQRCATEGSVEQKLFFSLLSTPAVYESLFNEYQANIVRL